MTKFGAVLNAEAVPEWRSAYLDFAGLKRLLFDVLLPALEASNGTRRNFTIRQHVSTDAPLGSPLSVLSQRTMRLVFGDPSGRHNDPSGRNMHDASARHSVGFDQSGHYSADSAASSGRFPPPQSRAGAATARLRRALAASLAADDDADGGAGDGGSAMDDEAAAGRAPPIKVEWATAAAPAEGGGSGGTKPFSRPSATVSPRVPAAAAEAAFFAALDEEAARVVAFYKAQEAVLTARFTEIVSALARHAQLCAAARAAAADAAAAAFEERAAAAAAATTPRGLGSSFGRSAAVVAASPAVPRSLLVRHQLQEADEEAGVSPSDFTPREQAAMARKQAERKAGNEGGAARPCCPITTSAAAHSPSPASPKFSAKLLPVPQRRVDGMTSAAAAAARADGRWLRCALVDWYRHAELLASFCKLNVTGFGKILKKRDKLASWACRADYAPFMEMCLGEGARLRVVALSRAVEREFMLLGVTPSAAAAAADARAKASRTRCGWPLLLCRPSLSAASHSTDPRSISAASTALLTAHHARRRAALARLRPPPPLPPPGRAANLAAGCLVGGVACAVATVVAQLAALSRAAHPSGPVAASFLSPIIRGPLLVALHFALYGAVEAVWEAHRVSAAAILGTGRGGDDGGTGASALRPEHFALLAGVVAAGWCAAWAGVLQRMVWSANAGRDAFTSVGSAPLLAPPLTLVCLLLLFLLPLPAALPQWPHRAVRLRALQRAGRVLTAPLWHVTLPDFFLADQAVSQQTALTDIGYGIALYCSGAALSGSVGTLDRMASRNNGTAALLTRAGGALAAPLVLLLGMFPLWLRVLQCGRRLRDERARLHVVNMCKYSLMMASFCATAFASTRGLPPPLSTASPPGSALLVSISVVTHAAASAAGFLWDTKMDWNMPLRWGGRTPFQHAALLANFVLRFAPWVALSAGGLAGYGSPFGMSTFVAVVEIIRRCGWSFLRLSAEHAANATARLAVRHLPLPRRLQAGAKDAELFYDAKSPRGGDDGTPADEATPAMQAAAPREMGELFKWESVEEVE